MAKPSGIDRTSKLDPEAVKLGIVEFDSESTVAYNSYVEPETVYIQSVFDARLLYTGQVSGKQYEWGKAGDICEVDMLDSEILLAKRIGGEGCCGSPKDSNKVFQIFAGGI
jgi:hypothetical protein